MIRKKIRIIAPTLIALVWVGLPHSLWAEIRLPAIIGDHMVIQQGKPVSIWGWAEPGEEVSIRLSGQEMKARASGDGGWRVIFPALKADGGPLEILVRGEQGPEVAVRDIQVGEVWVCSGQSNMEWPLSMTASPTPEILRADHPGIRLFLVPKRTSDRPQDDLKAVWTACLPETAAPFSAVAYYFGLELHQKLGIPVGLIESAWGGTAIEPWIPPVGLTSVPETKAIWDELGLKVEAYRSNLEKALPAWETWVRESRRAIAGKAELPPRPDYPGHPLDDPQAPTALYNGMIHPLIGLAVRGAIWYQGESNRNDGLAYGKKMEALIRGWREAWGLGEFPFLYVQLAPYDYPYDRESTGGDVPDFLRLPLIWEAQMNALQIPNTGMAVTTDITDLNDIHPRNKKDVGARLALWARARTYGETALVPSGPLYKSMSIEEDRIRIFFDYDGGGLIANDSQPLRWFEVAGDDHVFYKAEAAIDGETVVVRSQKVTAPKAVRFGWHQTAVPNLANRQGLPASPFRTDRW